MSPSVRFVTRMENWATSPGSNCLAGSITAGTIPTPAPCANAWVGLNMKEMKANNANKTTAVRGKYCEFISEIYRLYYHPPTVHLNFINTTKPSQDPVLRGFGCGQIISGVFPSLNSANLRLSYWLHQEDCHTLVE